MPSRSSRPQASRPRDSGAALDPYGIYGTRTANRMRAARRRRQTQNVVLLLSLVAVVAVGFALAKLRRVTAVKPSVRLNLSTPVVTAPVLARDDSDDQTSDGQTSDAQIADGQNSDGQTFILISATSGELLRLQTNFAAEETPQVVLDTAFPLHLPLVKKQVAFVPCEDGFLYAVDWRQSKVLWRYNFDSPLSAQPAAATFSVALPAAPAPATSSGDGEPATPLPTSVRTKVTREVVVAGADNGLIVALDARSGKPRWRTRVPAPIGSAIAIAGGSTPKILVPLLGAPFMRGGVWCLDAVTGKVLWRFPKDVRSEAMQFAAPIIDNVAGRAFFGGETGAIFSLNIASGTYDAKRKVGWKAYASPLKADSNTVISWRANPLLFFTDEYSGERDGRSTRLVLGGNDGGVRCLASRNGTLLWQFRTESPIASLKKMRRGEHDLILVCTRGYDLFVLDARTGRSVKRFASRGMLAGATLTKNEVLTVTNDGFVERFPLRL